MSEDVRLSTNQKKALAAILGSPSLVAAAEVSKLSDRTLRRYLSDPVFRAALAAAESDAIDQATRRLLQLTDRAIDTFDRVLSDPAAREGSQLRAAAMVVDNLIRLRDLAIEKRISELETAVYHGAKR